VEFDADVKPRLALIRRFRKIDARASVIAVASCEEMPALGLLRDLGITEVLTHAKEWVRVGIAPAPRPARIFVLDDEPTIVALLSRFLGSRGYEVQGACSGPDALKQLPDHQPDVLLFDLLMPGMTGLDVLRALRDMGFAGTGIALSAAQDDVLLRRLVNLAPVHLVGKPVDLERLALLLEAVLAIRSQA
jgi:CheY-like chemotaxis protein